MRERRENIREVLGRRRECVGGRREREEVEGSVRGLHGEAALDDGDEFGDDALKVNQPRVFILGNRGKVNRGLPWHQAQNVLG